MDAARHVFRKKPGTLIGGFLLVAVAIAYWNAADLAFLNYDDDQYVTANPRVREGLTLAGLGWALTTGHAGNWFPLTWVSHMLDVELFGLASSGHHLHNVFLHAANALLLFCVLRRMTGRAWRSGLVAALFALHPLNVESVAWVAERKSVLSTTFWMLTLWSYAGYARRPVRTTYAATLSLFALGLMAKPMLVTLPFVLLLLDYWPLERFRDGARARLFLEKVPFFLLSAASSAVTLAVQRGGGALRSLPLDLRLENALLSYAAYFGKALHPERLAVFYPHPGSLSFGALATASLVLAAISLLVLLSMRRFPYLTVGWLWYLGTLVPVIGFVQVGGQGMADRYAYVPLVGVFVMGVWGVSDLASAALGRRARTIALAAVAAGVLSLLTARTRAQLAYWRDSETLFRHALDVTGNNVIAHTNLGLALAEKGSVEEAIEHYSAALGIDSTFARAHAGMGAALYAQGRGAEAIEAYTRAVRADSGDPDLHYNLGIALAAMGRLNDAAKHYAEALRLRPGNVDVLNNLGNVLASRGRFEEAMGRYREALRIDPNDPALHNNLGAALASTGRLEEAIVQFEEALRLDPGHVDASANLERATAATR